MMNKPKKKKRNKFKQKDFRKALLQEMEAKYPHYNLKSNLLGAFFIIGLAFTVWEIKIYRETFIPYTIPLCVWLIVGLIVTPLFYRIVNIYIFNPYRPGRVPLVIHFFYNICSWGGIFVFLFMFANSEMRDKEVHNTTLMIQSSGMLSGGKYGSASPYVVITYQGLEKELIFSTETNTLGYKKVFIEFSKGLFGYDVILFKTLN